MGEPHIHICTSHDMHPYACGGPPAGCIHCRRKSSPAHRVGRCALCRDDRRPMRRTKKKRTP